MVDARYNEQMVDRLHERWLEDDRETCGCCKCGDEATMDIGGDPYCEDCAKEEYHTYDDEAFCSICEDEITEEVYKVGSEYFCEDCFLNVFRM